MSEVLTRDEEERRPTMRQLYEAARRERISRADERTFEEWCNKVSDYGLDDAEQAYIVYRDSDHTQLQSAVLSAAVARRSETSRTLGGAGDYIMTLHATMLAEHSAVDALIAFEAEHGIEEK